MSLLLILRKIWKYKLVTLPVIALVLAGAGYVMAVQSPTYEASATYILVNPPPPPTEAEILANPELGRIAVDNPYLRFSDGSVLVQVLASRLNSEEVRRSLAEQGADPGYAAQPSSEFGFSAPILQITGTGPTAVAAVGTADRVGRALTRELDRMQQQRGVDKDYRIKTEAVVAANGATLKASGKLRSLVAVLALGGIVLFIVISIAEALGALRTEWAQGRIRDHFFDDGGSLEPVLTPDSMAFADPDSDAEQWSLEAQQR